MGAADSTGLAYLMSLLGGIGEGGYKGYAGGMEDQQKAANLAEKKREFDEGSFTDITPEMGQRLGMPVGRVRNTIMPALLNASEKEAARKATATANEAGAAALEKAASQFPEGGRLSEPSLDLGENPEAAGTTPPPQTPNRYLQMFADLQRADTKAEPMVNQWMKMNMAAKGKPGTSEFFAPHYTLGPNGEVIAIQQPKATGIPGQAIDTGIRGRTPTSALERAIKDFQDNPTQENWQRMSMLGGFTPIAPGGSVASKPALAGMQGPGGAPMGAPTGGVGPGNPIVASQPAQPGNDAVQDIASANSAIANLEDVVRVLRSGALDNVLGGVAKNFEGAKNRVTESYLGYGQSDEQRAAMAKLGMHFQTIKRDLIGATRTVPELKDIQNAIPDEKSLIRGDTAQQMLPKIETMIAKAKRDIAMRQRALQESNYRSPSEAPSAPAVQEAPWTDLGNGIRIREKRR